MLKKLYIFIIGIILLSCKLEAFEIQATPFQGIINTNFLVNEEIQMRLNETITTTMQSNQSHHTYELIIEKPGKLTIDFNSNFNSYFSLKSEQGDYIISSLFASDKNYQYLSEGKYKIEVWNKNIGNGGEYEITPIFEEFVLNEFEPNDTFENAQLIQSQSYIKGMLVHKDKYDWFKFVLTESSKIEMTYSDQSNLSCSLYDENKKYIRECRYANEYVEAGTYYILVENGGFSRTGPYEFNFHVTPIKSQDIEPNNTPESAQLLDLNDTMNGLISYQDKFDIYKIKVINSGLLDIEFNTNARISLELLGDNLNKIFSRYGAHGGEAYLNSGDYYIKIGHDECYDSAPNKCGPYELKLTFEEENTNEFEPNNSIQTAREIVINEEIQASFFERDEIDIYKLKLDEAGKIDINFFIPDNMSKVTPISIKLIDDAGQFVENHWMTTGQTFSSYVNAGVYYIEVKDRYTDYYQPYHRVLYCFNTEFTPKYVDDQEENNTIVSAQPLTLGATFTGLINFQDQLDIYTFSVTKDEMITIDINSKINDLNFLLLDENQNIIYGETNANVNKILSIEQGNYYIKINSFSNNEQGIYTLRLNNSHVKRVSYFRAENGQLYIDGYSYVKGVNIPNKSDIIQKLKFVDVNTGKQVKTYELPNFYSTAASKDPNHGAGVYNYDWAKFKGHLDVSDLPVGDYYIKIYTNAKKNAYDEIIEFHSSIGDFSFQTNGKDYQFVREGNTLRLSVEAVQPEQPEQPEQPTPPVTNENPHVKRVSYFRAENGQLYLDGYSYVKGINIPNQSDIIQKLKFVNVNTGKQVKTYELPNFYSTAASKDPNHGAGLYNYDWAKFKGYLDVSDLPTGEYYIKIYTNAKKNAYDEIIAFHSSIGDFSFESSGKVFNFERLDVNGVGTLKLVVSEITTIDEDEAMTVADEGLTKEDEEIQVEIEKPEEINQEEFPEEKTEKDLENEMDFLEANEQTSDIESNLNHI